MRAVAQFLGHSARYVAGAVLTFALWCVWFVLIAIALGQVYIATHNEVPVPDFVLRNLEARLAENGLKAKFERATFDPTGRILVTAPQVFLPDFEDPVITARGAYVGLNPWALATGKFEPREVRLLDATLQVPAMLSPSGRAEPIVRDVDALVIPGDKEIVIRHISGRIAALQVSVHGQVARTRTPGKSPAEFAATVRTRFAEFCKGAVSFTRRLEDLEEPSLDLELTSSPRGAIVTADLLARGYKLAAPFAAQAKGLHAVTRLPLFGDAPAASRLDVTADELMLPNGIEMHGVNAILRGRVRPAELRIEPVEVDLAAQQVHTPDGAAAAISLVARPRGGARWHAVAVGQVLDSALSVTADADLQVRTASVRFRGSIAPRILEAINGRTRVDVRNFFNFESARCDLGQAEFGPGWKFERLSAHVWLRGINAHGVTMDEGTATVELDPRHLYAPEAYARIGENFARGTYEHEFATREFRFLLDGRLRPMAIAEWFRGWWPNFFEHFSFPAEPPLASVDVHGFWKEGRRTSVFVFADAKAPVVLGQKLARVRTRLFIRPGFYDALELHAGDPQGGAANGTFTFAANMNSGKWRSIDFAGESTVALVVANGIGGELAHPILSPFALAQPPTVKAQGHFDGPDLGANRHQSLDLSARTKGTFTFYHLPFEDVAFTTTLRDDVLTIDSPQAKFAGGNVRLHAKVWGEGAERRLGFDLGVTDASLGVAVAALQKFAAEHKGLPPSAPGKFVQEKANVRADLTASAEGLYGNTLSFHGTGNASLRGAEIGEVPLFGPLSELLKFTALRFTTGRTTFKINGAKVEFPEVALRGANSAIDAHGEYALDRKQLDFRAKVFPFQESGSVIKTVVGAVLSPISNVLEVKLTGTLEKPEWAFVIGPTNLLRSLAPNEPTPVAAPQGQAPQPGTAPAKAAEAPPPVPAPVKPAEALAPKDE